MPSRSAAALFALLLTACTGAAESDDPERAAANARQRIKLEDLTYCTAEAQDRAEAAADDPRFAAFVDRCMAGLGYSRLTALEGDLQ